MLIQGFQNTSFRLIFILIFLLDFRVRITQLAVRGFNKDILNYKNSSFPKNCSVHLYALLVVEVEHTIRFTDYKRDDFSGHHSCTRDI